MPDKDAFIFDLDGTLAESKAPLTDMMASTLGKFLAIKKVSIISGGNFKQFETQVVDRIKEVVEHAIIHKEHVIATPRFENLYPQLRKPTACRETPGRTSKGFLRAFLGTPTHSRVSNGPGFTAAPDPWMRRPGHIDKQTPPEPKRSGTTAKPQRQAGESVAATNTV